MNTAHPAEQEPRYAWIVVWASFTALAVIFGVAYSFAAFFESFATAFSASRAEVSLVFGLSGLLYFVLGAFGGMLSDRYGPRRITCAGMLCIAAALGLGSVATSITQLTWTYGIGLGVGLDRCLRRHGVSDLKSLQPEIEGPAKPLKTFKDYEPGFLHIDIKYLPQMPDETQRRYLFVAIDRATRWVFMRTYRDQSEGSSTDFLRRLKRAAPMEIKTILTDNGSQFTDRFTSKVRIPSGKHVFDLVCKSMDIEHRLCPPRHPQTNGMVERFNGRISELVKQTRFKSAAEIDLTLANYWSTYNHRIPQRALGHQTPIQALKEWQAKKPELFVKRVYKQTGLDS